MGSLSLCSAPQLRVSQDFFFLFLLNLTSLTGTFPTHSLVTLPGAAVSQGDKLHEPEFREHHLNCSSLLSVSRHRQPNSQSTHTVSKGQVAAHGSLFPAGAAGLSRRQADRAASAGRHPTSS